MRRQAWHGRFCKAASGQVGRLFWHLFRDKRKYIEDPVEFWYNFYEVIK